MINLHQFKIKVWNKPKIADFDELAYNNLEWMCLSCN